MQELSRKILEKYQVRKTRAQKTEFIEFLKQELPDYPMTIEEGGLFKSRNIIVGDLEKSHYVLGAHYDTQPVLPFPNFLTPKNLLVYLLFNLLLVFALFTIMGVIGYLVEMMTNDRLIGFLCSYVFLVFFLVWMMVGKANKHTANDNTSGVITLIEALHDEQLKDKVCCVFFDHEEIGLIGSSFFAKKHKNEMKHKLLINFDCVSDGDAIMMIASKTVRSQMERMKQCFKSDGQKHFVITKSSTTLYPSDQVNFKHYIGVATFKQNRWIGYYIDRIHTSKDTIFEEKNIEMIIDGLKEFTYGHS